MGGVVPPGDWRAAQVLTGLAMALWLAIGYVPALRRHVGAVRLGLLLAYAVACGGILLHALLAR